MTAGELAANVNEHAGRLRLKRTRCNMAAICIEPNRPHIVINPRNNLWQVPTNGLWNRITPEPRARR